MVMVKAPGCPEVGLQQEQQQTAVSMMGRLAKSVLVDMSPCLLLHHQVVAASHCTKVVIQPGVLESVQELWPHPVSSFSIISLGSVWKQEVKERMFCSETGWQCSWQDSPGGASSSLVSG